MHSIAQEIEVIFASSNTSTNEGLESITLTNIHRKFLQARTIMQIKVLDYTQLPDRCR
jgi:hypothetical protein